MRSVGQPLVGLAVQLLFSCIKIFLYNNINIAYVNELSFGCVS